MRGNRIGRRKCYETENAVSAYANQKNDKTVSAHVVTGNFAYAAHRCGCFLCCQKYGAGAAGGTGGYRCGRAG